jgi:hypothetical protein
LAAPKRLRPGRARGTAMGARCRGVAYWASWLRRWLLRLKMRREIERELDKLAPRGGLYARG